LGNKNLIKGLGSCFTGYPVAAVKKYPSLRKHIGIAADEDIHSVIAPGYPCEPHQLIAGRKKVSPRYFEG
jgi:hypothetical protein